MTLTEEEHRRLILAFFPHGTDADWDQPAPRPRTSDNVLGSMGPDHIAPWPGGPNIFWEDHMKPGEIEVWCGSNLKVGRFTTLKQILDFALKL